MGEIIGAASVTLAGAEQALSPATLRIKARLAKNAWKTPKFQEYRA